MLYCLVKIGMADIVEGLSMMEQSVRETVKIFEFAKMYEQLGVEDTCQ